MKDLWERLEAWGTKVSAGSLKLRGGATEKKIAAAEKKMKVKFPPDFRESLLLHDGQEAEPGFDWMPGCSPLQPLEAIIERWKEERDIEEEYGNEDAEDDAEDDARLKAGMYLAPRIPIAGSPYWDGDNTYVDLAPGSKGKSGQIITFTTECDLTVLGDSFRSTLERYVKMLEDGKLVWAPGYGVAPKKKGKWADHPAEQFAKMK